MFDLIVTIIILYLLYKLVFDFIVPVSKTTSQFKKQVNQMRMQQEEQMRQQQQQNNRTTQNKTTSNTKNTTTTDGEYIDYEDVK